MKRTVLVALACALAAGCATRESGSVYKQGEAGREQTVRFATVEAVRKVTVAGNRSGLGTLAGGALGGIAGSGVGEGRGAAVGAVLGGVAGAIGGEAVEEAATRQEADEITVRLENGELRAIVQKHEEDFKPGERVRLLSSGGVTRVTRP